MPQIRQGCSSRPQPRKHLQNYKINIPASSTRGAVPLPCTGLHLADPRGKALGTDRIFLPVGRQRHISFCCSDLDARIQPCATLKGAK
jgi:hypothetical protein